MHGRLLTGSSKMVEFHANSGFSKETFIQENLYHTIISILVCLKNSRYNFTYCTNSNAAADPNPTREFMLGEPCLNALRPSKSICEKEWHLPQCEEELIKYLKNTVQDHAGNRFQCQLAFCS